MARLMILALLATIAAHPAHAAGFDCTKATTRVEKTICADKELSALDEHLGRFYAAALDVLNQSPCLKTEQREWLANTRNRCEDASCLRAAYLRRLGALLALQPGMNLPKNVDVPVTPRLRWIIPPAADTVATPKLNSKPFQAAGTLDYVLEKGGYVLDTGDGRLHTLIPDLVIDDGSVVHLGVLKDMRAKVVVSGKYAVVNAQGMFDNRSCITIYEKP